MAISPHDLSTRQLQYVVAVADTLGFHKAADKCHVSQPTLSAQIKQIEDVLGLQIFERDKRRVLLTPAGKVIVDHARRVLIAIDEMLAAAKQLNEPYSGIFRVGIIPTIAPYFLPEIVPAVRTRYAKLQLIFREEKTDSIIQGLREGRLDAGLLALEADIQENEWAIARITNDPFVIALPSGHPLTRKKRIAPNELTHETVLLLDEGHCFRAQALSVCDQVGAKETEVRATSLSTLAQMVSSGLGITLLPEMAVSVENRRSQLEVRPFASPVPHRTIALIWRRQSPFSEMFRKLVEVFRAGLRAAPATG